MEPSASAHTGRAQRILAARAGLMAALPGLRRAEEAAEGGCGVLGFAASLPVAGQHVLAASQQMHNRGNGKGGGIAMAGLTPDQARVDRRTLRSHYLLQIALLDPTARSEVESAWIVPHFDIAQDYALPQVDDYRDVDGLEVRPPQVQRYFVRVRPDVLARFAAEKSLDGLPERAIEDEFVYQNSFAINRQFYASLGEKRAFVLSHGRNLSVLKIVGYAEQVVEYYRLQDQAAHVWIAHQRYPTKGRVWHPGGAHPFIGLNEALVHNGDFANYHAVGEYLRQRNVGQLFLTDTEVSVQLFDLWDRVCGYPLEITLEAMAPTSEHDFAMLSAEKQALYRAVQRTHIHGSPDGPWFFIVARSTGGEEHDRFELLGITDTSMLRPQVFALYENRPDQVQIGLIASERQAINACLRSLSESDARFQPYADRYWAARGGSHTDGGAFRFTVELDSSSIGQLACADKFSQPVQLDPSRRHLDAQRLDAGAARPEWRRQLQDAAQIAFDDGGAATLYEWLRPHMPALDWNDLAWGLNCLGAFGSSGDDEWRFVLDALSLLRDRRYDLGSKKRASLLRLLDAALLGLFGGAPALAQPAGSLESVRRVGWADRRLLSGAPGASGQRAIPSMCVNATGAEGILVLDAGGFPPEGDDSAARAIVQAFRTGWKHVVAYGWRGGRFAGSGLGANTAGLRLDLFGDTGDYAASGLDGAEVHLHGDGQDQLGQVMKRGRLVIHGDVGQTFLYGAKGGEIYVLGSAAGRPLINAVGAPRAVINGTCLDYLAESFMAGDPLKGGGFVIVNGVAFDENSSLYNLETPYPGGNLFSLASGGAIYLRDPHRRVSPAQLNGGEFLPLTAADWELIEPYLRENERLFAIAVDDLLRVGGQICPPEAVYRKVAARGAGMLADTENR